jgi:hypothetical protein
MLRHAQADNARLLKNLLRIGRYAPPARHHAAAVRPHGGPR